MDFGGEFIDVEADWSEEGFSSIAGRNKLADFGKLGASVSQNEPVVISDNVSDENCPSSDDLRLIRHIEKGGSGSSGVTV